MSGKFICLNCRRPYIPTRSDQMFCCKWCRNRYFYVPVPKCKECSLVNCEFRDERLKYAPKNCPDRVMQ